MSRLCLVLGDQLSRQLSSLQAIDAETDHVVMAEVSDEATYVPHHPKKIVFIFSAMRHFAETLREAGYRVTYYRYGSHSHASLEAVLRDACEDAGIDEIVVTQCGEWRLHEQMQTWSDQLERTVTILPDERFLCPLEDFADWAEGRKQYRMEYFYREMRKRSGLLMDGDEPVGGSWNYDESNRKAWKGEPQPPEPLRHEPDQITSEVLTLVKETFTDHYGQAEPFWFAVTAEQAQENLDHFIARALPNFGDYQDAMSVDQPFLFHSLISMYLNAGLLEPLAVCRAAEQAWRDGKAPLNAVEGFIRQIIGWREYVRGLYWLLMPDYAEHNYFSAQRDLPDFYWSGETRMACVAAAVTVTMEEAYAHHIQRLMVTGNLALLLGLEPKQVCDWYLAVYADAYEWVELPNTLGMALFGDGGVMASKPYAASGNYIKRMSDYCSGCYYRVAETTGERACPYNALYWNFLDRHRDLLADNPRMAMMYRNLERMDEDKLAAINERSEWLLNHVNEL
ncbi:MAG: cryptochrome/photolyase family protein [Wenzhouxiangellaceae bacterium]